MIEEIKTPADGKIGDERCSCGCDCDRSVKSSAKDTGDGMADDTGGCSCTCPSRGKSDASDNSTRESTITGRTNEVLEEIEMIINVNK